jgi:hypothetical protein
MKLFDALSIRLENYKINYLNLYDYSKGKDLKVFWNTDYHFNDYGHQIVAETLFAKYRGIFFRVAAIWPNTCGSWICALTGLVLLFKRGYVRQPPLVIRKRYSHAAPPL